MVRASEGKEHRVNRLRAVEFRQQTDTLQALRSTNAARRHLDWAGLSGSTCLAQVPGSHCSPACSHRV